MADPSAGTGLGFALGESAARRSRTAPGQKSEILPARRFESAAYAGSRYGGPTPPRRARRSETVRRVPGECGSTPRRQSRITPAPSAGVPVCLALAYEFL